MHARSPHRWPVDIRGGQAAGYFLLALLCLTLWVGTPAIAAGAAQKIVPRTIIALYDGAEWKWSETNLHRMAEMPLNHLGLVVEPHDIAEPLPDLTSREDVRGVITWWSGEAFPEPSGYLDWATRAADRGTRFLIMGNLGFLRARSGEQTPGYLVDGFLKRLGLQMQWSASDPGFTSVSVLEDRGMVGFEHALPPGLKVSEAVLAIDPQAQVFLRVQGRSGLSDLVVATRNAGYVADGYTHYSVEGSTFRQWYVNPFALFSLAFGLSGMPVPDTTTMTGRRIYFSHVDGDGWRNETQIAPYRDRHDRAIDVLIDEVFTAFPDLPVTVAAIAGDLDPDWCGDERARSAARVVYALPNVEAASHTYSHPFFWGMFEKGAPAEGRIGDPRCAGAPNSAANPLARAYTRQAFDLDLEVGGAASYIGSFLPAGKRLRLLQWSGDTDPFSGAVAATQAAGLLNINGGDSRFDTSFPSVSWVSPLGRHTSGGWQIYAAASNENTYTHLWTSTFYGFGRLIENIRRMESPRRLKPINIYYHAYSGEKLSSLNALLGNIRFAQTQGIAPLTTLQYAKIANGFYSCRIVDLGDQRWRFEERGALQTLRFDDRPDEVPDLARSEGVMGWRRHQGSLYVALDPAHPAPALALTREASEQPASLVESRWPVRRLARAAGEFSFEAAGFGPGEMMWRVPRAGRYQVTWSRASGISRQVVDRQPDGTISFTIPFAEPAATVFVRIQPLSNGTARSGPPPMVE